MLASNIRAILLDAFTSCLPRYAVPDPGQPHGHRPAATPGALASGYGSWAQRRSG
jgi:hypothetical protein